MRPIITKVRAREFIGPLIKPCKKCGYEIPGVENEFLSDDWQVFCHYECGEKGPIAVNMNSAIEEWNKLQEV
jgi:hypothetical protein